MLTEKLKDQWHIRYQDYFTYCYNADSLLNGFYQEMDGFPAICEKWLCNIIIMWKKYG